MEDNSGGISGMIIRGIPTATATSVELLGSGALPGVFNTVSEAQVEVATKTIKVSIIGKARFFRVKGSDRILSTAVSGGDVEIRYQ